MPHMTHLEGSDGRPTLRAELKRRSIAVHGDGMETWAMLSVLPKEHARGSKGWFQIWRIWETPIFCGIMYLPAQENQ